jgi:hypothetical protein
MKLYLFGKIDSSLTAGFEQIGSLVVIAKNKNRLTELIWQNYQIDFDEFSKEQKDNIKVFELSENCDEQIFMYPAYPCVFCRGE